MQQLQRTVHQLAVRDDNERQADVLGRQAEHLRRDRLLGLLEDDGQRTVRLDHAVLHIRDRGDVLLAQRLDHLVGGQPHLAQLLDIELAAADDDRRLAVEQPPEKPFRIEPGKPAGAEHERRHVEGVNLKHDQRRDRDDARGHWDAEILHGHSGKVGDQNRDHELGRVEFADLPLAHQANRGDHGEV